MSINNIITIGQVRERLLECCTLMGFYYKGIKCDIEPFSQGEYWLFCEGDHDKQQKRVNSVDEALIDPYFMGYSLAEIIDEVEFDEW